MDMTRLMDIARLMIKKYLYEFLVCHFHGCECQAEPDWNAREKWCNKRERLEKLGTVIYMWECDWNRMLMDTTVTNTRTHFPRIMNRSESDADLVQAVKDGSFFGFIHCDLW